MMKSKLIPIMAACLALAFVSCGGTEKVKDKVLSWFRDDPRTRGQTRRLSQDEFMDKVRGAWAGKMIGVSYGSPYRFRYLGRMMESGEIRPWLPEYVSNAMHQDNLYVQMSFLHALEEKGLTISTAEAGRYFAQSQYALSHANEAARQNIRAGIQPPESGHPRYNPHADDVDFQNEADLFGILCPALPVSAVRMAETFGRLMNYGDGVYGGLFVAGMYSVAYMEKDPETVVRLGLAGIPARSRYAQLITDVLDYHQANPENWQGCWTMLEEKWAQNDLCPDGFEQPFNIDAKLNGGYVALGLLYGQGDFAKTLEITTRCGQGTDANASTAAGLVGAMVGYGGIPRNFTIGIPLIANRNFSFTPYNFDTLTKTCARLAREMIERNAGNIERLGEREYFEIVIQRPTPPERLEQFTPSMHRDYKNQWDNLPHIRGEGLHRRLQTVLDQFANGWKVTQCGLQINPVLLERYQDRYNVFMTHPLDRETPCRLSRKVTIPAQNPTLHLIVSSFDGAPNADWLLRVKANEQVIAEKLIGPVNGRFGWHDLKVDLSPFAEQETTLVLENTADDDGIETAYWATIEIQ
jgi:hypothetical protein